MKYHKMKNTRRDFLKASVLASGSLFIPTFLKGFDVGTHRLGKEQGKVLVIIQMSGGNDGLNACVPYRNDIYYQSRPTLAVKDSDVLKLNDEIGFNPVMEPMKALFDDGLVSVINNVGYPDPNRSHFRSMDIWQTASGAKEYLSTGWLGRYLDLTCKDCNPYHALEMDDTLSLSMKGVESSGFAVGNLAQLKKTTGSPFLKTVAHHHDHAHEENVAYLYRTMASTISSADYLYEQAKTFSTKTVYPGNKLGKTLKQVAELIIAGTDTRVYYVNFDGFDTHARQRGMQDNLLKQYALAMKAFTDDLRTHNLIDDTLVMTFSEFGRRVKQNASGGTDHGTANNMYLVGGGLKNPGVFNSGPNLLDLDNGDLKYEIDFRRVYATILKNWLGVKDGGVLGRKFELLDVV
ncbi:MAG: DUF1501 domain-containing protein [Bacteroidota bacterium]